jgi:AcrR family transcriptional regulator
MSASNAAMGLRERKKLSTRQAISNTATRLFIERGFESVTIAEIAAAANVSKMTVSNYFPRKEDLFFDREEEGQALMREALTRRAAGQSPLDALHALGRTLLEQQHPFAKISAGTAQFWRTVADSPALSGRAREMRDVYMTELTSLLAQAVGKAQSDPHAQLAAALLVATWTTAYAASLRQHHANATDKSIRRTFNALIESGFKGVAAAMAGTPYA